MGYSVPGAVGAKLARPNHEVIVFVGDGGFMMTGQELVTAVEQKLPVRIIVCDNAVHGSILAGQDKTFGPGNDIATVLQSLDFCGRRQGIRCRGLHSHADRRLRGSIPKSLERPKAHPLFILSRTGAILRPMAKDGRPCINADQSIPIVLLQPLAASYRPRTAG